MPIVQWPIVATLTISARRLVARIVASTIDVEAAALMTCAKGPTQESPFK